MDSFETFDLNTVFVPEPRWSSNAKLGKGDGNCIVCNRRMTDYAVGNYSVHMSTSNTLFPAEILDHPDSQGVFDIGTECAKRIPKQFLIGPRV
jgi:hypothetical protein